MTHVNLFNTTLYENKDKNLLVRLENDVIFYMDIKGNFLPTRDEKNTGQGLCVEYWNTIIPHMKLMSIRPTQNQIQKIKIALSRRTQYLDAIKKALGLKNTVNTLYTQHATVLNELEKKLSN